MAKVAKVRLGGPLIELSEDGDRPLSDQALLASLFKKLTFTRVNLDYVAGRRAFETVALFAKDAKGRLICQKGFFDAVCKILDDFGYSYEFIDERKRNEESFVESWDDVLSLFEFRPSQKECLAGIVTRIRRGLGGIVEAAPGFGKTKLISMICALYKKAKIDIISYGNELLDDIRRHILEHTPSVGRAYGSRVSNERIMVISSRSLQYIRPEADIVLVDEVHRAVTDNISKELNRYQTSCMFGFTATAKTRIDNLHYRLEALFGPTIFSSSWQDSVSKGLSVPILVQWIKVNEGTNVSRFYSNQALRKRFGYWRNRSRNYKISLAASKYVSKGLQTLVLVETIEHALFLKQLLPEFEVCFGGVSKNSAQYRYLSRLFPGEKLDISLKERRNLKSKFENREVLGVIATPIWATGVSFDSLQVLIRADGGGSETNCHQWPGRVARIDDKTGKEVGVVVDFLDLFDDWAYHRSLFRRRIYRKNDWQQNNPFADGGNHANT